VTVFSSLLFLYKLRWVSSNSLMWRCRWDCQFMLRRRSTVVYSLRRLIVRPMRASLFAIARTTTFLGALASSRSSHGPMGA